MNKNIFEFGRAICYSGYRKGQSPDAQIFPTKEQILEDLKIISGAGFKYIRMYDAVDYAQNVCECIRQNKIPLKLMLGPGLINEVNNKDCPWDKTVYTQEELSFRAKHNRNRIHRLAELGKEYGDVIFCVSVGNENTPDWGQNTVPESVLIEFADYLKKETGLYVTFNEGAREWPRLTSLAEHLDIISIHSYPLWYGNSVSEAVNVNRADYLNIKSLFSDKPVIFTEAGWATKSNNPQMNEGQASEENQAAYYKEFWSWTDAQKITAFVFEAFDEPWKGNALNCDEPEKHWGIYNEDRTPKKVVSLLNL